MPPIREQPLKISDVMAHFRVSRRTVERWFKQGLEHYYMGKTPYTTFDALGRFARAAGPSLPSLSAEALAAEALAADRAAQNALYERHGIGPATHCASQARRPPLA